MKPYIEIERQVREAPSLCVIVRARMLAYDGKNIMPDAWVHRFEDEDGVPVNELVFTAEDAADIVHIGKEIDAALNDALAKLLRENLAL